MPDLLQRHRRDLFGRVVRRARRPHRGAGRAACRRQSAAVRAPAFLCCWSMTRSVPRASAAALRGQSRRRRVPPEARTPEPSTTTIRLFILNMIAQVPERLHDRRFGHLQVEVVEEHHRAFRQVFHRQQRLSVAIDRRVRHRAPRAVERRLRRGVQPAQALRAVPREDRGLVGQGRAAAWQSSPPHPGVSTATIGVETRRAALND